MTTDILLPAERIAFAVAFAQVRRGETPPPNTTTMCVLALARLTDVHDWTLGEARDGE